MATPPYPRGMHIGRIRSFLSTPLPIKFICLLSSPSRCSCVWNSQCSWIKMMSLNCSNLCIAGPQVFIFLQLNEIKCSWELSGFSAPVFSITYGLAWDFAGLKKAVVLEFALCFYCHVVLDYVEVWSMRWYLSTFVGVAQQGSLYFAYLLHILVFTWRQGHCSAVLAVLLSAGWLIVCSSMVAQ